MDIIYKESIFGENIQDIDILYFLANMEDNCLYKIELYKKYY